MARSVRACTRTALAGALVLGALGADDARAASLYDWPQFNGNPQHSGNNTQETLISASNVASLKQLFQVTLPSVADGAPAVLTQVSTGGGVHNLVFASTRDGHVLALDANSGASVWQNSFGPGTCMINGGSGACYTTSSPAVDPGRAFVYAYGLDGHAHKLAAGTGAESTSGGWPELITQKNFNEKGSSALSVATSVAGRSYLYVTTGGYPGDGGDYQGHVTAIDLSTGAQNVFNSLCSNQTAHFVETPGTPDCAQVQSGIWARGGVVYDQAIDEILAVTGNATFDPSTFNWGDTVFSLTPAGQGSAGAPLDSYTPTNFQALQDADLDLGSTSPAILPVPAGSHFPHIALQSGKDAQLRLLNLDNLSNQGTGPSPGRTGGELAIVSVPQGGQVLTAIAVWVNPSDGSTWVFVANGNGIAALKLTIDGSGNPGLSTQWHTTTGGTSPVVANGVLYYATSSGSLLALNPTTGTQLWQGTIGGIHWQSPVVANGIVYIEDNASHLTAFALPASAVVPALPDRTLWFAAGALLSVGVLAIRRKSQSPA
jgi:outer membrane protein assembly factor BamB